MNLRQPPKKSHFDQVRNRQIELGQNPVFKELRDVTCPRWRLFFNLPRSHLSMSELAIYHLAIIWMIHRHWEPRVFSGYSVRKACIGSILVARLAGNHAAATVITETAAIAMEIAVGSSGLNS